ncbi:MAG: hypothetical protein ABMB14_24625, partial [Myxococcota bacterium]
PACPGAAMANFSTHALGAVGAGVVASSILASADLLPLASVATGVALVGLGGIFPDVDSDHSDALTLVFDTLSVGIAVPLMIAAMPAFGLLVSLGVLVVAWLVLRYVAIVPFRWFTVHRGRFHSIPTGLTVAAALALVAHRALGFDPIRSWTFGGLFLLGFVVHLILDELFSVDLGNRRIKRSFGTALKLGEIGDPLGYLVLYAGLAVLVLLAPSPVTFVQACAEIDLQLLPPAAVLDRFADLRPVP